MNDEELADKEYAKEMSELYAQSVVKRQELQADLQEALSDYQRLHDALRRVMIILPAEELAMLAVCTDETVRQYATEALS